jgi:hypothetical protein
MSREGSHRACHGRAYCLRRLPRVWHHTPLGVSVALLAIILGWIAIVTAFTAAQRATVYMTYSFLQKFLGAGFAGGCLIPLLSERSEVRGVTRRNNSVKYYWKISSISR